MPFFNGGHLWIIAIVLIIVLIIWGPGKLPDVGSGLGRAIHEFRKASTATKEEFAKATRADTPTDTTTAPAAPAADAAPAAPVAQPAPVGVTPSGAVEHAAGEGEATTST
jgi:TatA/E family protein of Tat protein translocase